MIASALLAIASLTSACAAPDRIIMQSPNTSWTLAGTLQAAPDPFRMQACTSYGAQDEIFIDGIEPMAYTPGGWSIVWYADTARGFVNNLPCGLWQPDAHTIVLNCEASP